MKNALILAVLAAPLLVAAEPHAVVLGARSGVDPSSIASSCQPSCTAIIKTLDACSSGSCECTQANYAALGVCMNCLVALGPQFIGSSYGDTYLDGTTLSSFPLLRGTTDCLPPPRVDFLDSCAGFGIVLNEVTLTATPTGASSAGDPFTPFEPVTPTSGATVAVTASLPPLIPNPATQGQPPKKNGATGGGVPLIAGAAVAAIAGALVL
ncbi:hypothetical protein BC834DRAFT_973491 [Gloeopeniophorella convolvens]|nr:hypothetical protein BC834DRAFT_973491 [Gloeopeniophorella convolvens]